MDLKRVEIGREADVVSLAAFDRRHVAAVTRAGEVLAVDLERAETRPLFEARGLTAVECPGGQVVACVGSRGALARWDGVNVRTEVVDADVRLTDLAVRGGETTFVVGEYDERTGVVFTAEPPDRSWQRRLMARTPAGLLASAESPSGARVVCGRRGYAAFWDEEGYTQVETGTDHPLRAAIVDSDGRWYAGGGGWAADMPILLAGDRRTAQALTSAPGDRVIVGLAWGANGSVWIAENRTDGTGWRGLVSRYRGNSLQDLHEEPEQGLTGLVCVSERLVIYGRRGFIAWVDLP